MKMTPRLLFGGLIAGFFWLTPAISFADSNFVAPIRENLREDGFNVVKVKRTWLGRILIVSRKGDALREVVINRRTGEVLRDKTFPHQANSQMPGAPGMGTSGTGMGGSNSGGGMGEGSSGAGNGGGPGH